MSLDYKKIFKRARLIVRKHKFLWVLGLFLVLGQVFNVLNFVPTSNQPSPLDPKRQSAITAWVDSHLFWAGLIVIGFLLLLIALVILYFRSKAAIITAAGQIVDQKAVSFKSSFKAGKPFLGRLFLTTVLLTLLIFLLTFVLASPIIYLFSINLASRAVLLGILALIIFIPVSLVIYFLGILAPMFIVLSDLKIRSALKSSLDLVTKFFWTLLVFSLLLSIVTFAVVLISLLVATIVAIPFVVLAVKLYDLKGIAGLGLVGGGVLLALVIFLILQGAVSAFFQTSWVLAFLELVRPVKTEEEKAAGPIPEAVSGS